MRLLVIGALALVGWLLFFGLYALSSFVIVNGGWAVFGAALAATFAISTLLWWAER